MKITDVSLFKVRGAYSGPYFPPGDRQAQMKSRNATSKRSFLFNSFHPLTWTLNNSAACSHLTIERFCGIVGV